MASLLLSWLSLLAGGAAAAAPQGDPEPERPQQEQAQPEPELVLEEADELRRHGARSERAYELVSWAWPAAMDLRETLAERGLTLEAYLTVDLSAHVSGGADPGSEAFRGLFDLQASFDADRLLGLGDGQLVVGLQVIDGEDGSADVGVIQPYSNIDDPSDRVQLARIWYEQRWNEGASHARVGKMDANALFADVRCAVDFLHSSMGFSPTVLGLPTYPDPAFGGAVRQALAAGTTLSVGVFDGAAQEGVLTGEEGPSTLFGEPSDLFLIGQAGFEWGDERPGRLLLGGWRHTGDFERFDGGPDEDGTSGAYAVLEQRVHGERDEIERAIDVFLQLGTADGDVSEIEGHVGCGVVAWGWLWPAREDVLGLGLSSAILSDEPGAGFDTEAETAFELFWGLELVPGVRIAPDLQVVVDPGGDASLDEAWIATLRLSVSL